MSTTLAPPRSTGLPQPPLGWDADPPGGSGWVFLACVRNDIEAHLLEGRLRDAGIEVSMCKDRSGPAWLFGGSNPWAPVTLMVRRFHLDDARIVMAEIAYGAPEHSSPEPVSSGPGWRAAVLVALALVLGALFTAIGLTRTVRAFEGCAVPIACAGDRR